MADLPASEQRRTFARPVNFVHTHTYIGDDAAYAPFWWRRGVRLVLSHQRQRAGQPRR